MSDDRRMDRLDEKSGPPAGLIGGGILAALVVIFIFQNTESAPVKFLMFDGEAKMWVVIVISVVAGVVLDRLLGFWFRRRRRRGEG